MPRPARLADRSPAVRPTARRGAGAAFCVVARDRPAHRAGAPQHGHERRFREGDTLWRDPCSGRHRDLRHARRGPIGNLLLPSTFSRTGPPLSAFVRSAPIIMYFMALASDYAG